MILTSVFESIKRECFPLSRGLVVGHCSVDDAGRDNRTQRARLHLAARSQERRIESAGHYGAYGH
jgi:hypothetical protein